MELKERDLFDTNWDSNKKINKLFYECGISLKTKVLNYTQKINNKKTSKMNHNLAIQVCEGLSLIGSLESFF